MLQLHSDSQSDISVQSRPIQQVRPSNENVDMIVANVLDELIADVCLREASAAGNAMTIEPPQMPSTYDDEVWEEMMF